MKKFSGLYRNANEAYEYFHDVIIQDGLPFGDTKCIFNVGFYMTDSQDNKIINRERNWSQEYAEAEWQWYLTGSPYVFELGKIYGKVPEIWKRMANDAGKVNSNYGWQWQRKDYAEKSQIDYIVEKLKNDKDTRQATISIYDGKEHEKYEKDTPCTYAIQFTILDNRLLMCVTMRSNDLWYGFCNDQYCFSKLQKMIADELSIDVGAYFHFAHNLHLYNYKI